MKKAVFPALLLLALPLAAAGHVRHGGAAESGMRADTAALRAAVRQAERETGGRVGVHVRHLETGETFAARGGEPFFMASVGKLPLAVHVMRQVEAGHVRLDDVVRLDSARMMRSPTAFRRRVSAGSRVTVAELLDAAISDSDNTAANELLHLTGGPDSVTAELRRLGLRGISLNRDYTRLQPPSSPTDTRDTATPHAVGELLAALWNGRLVGPAATRHLMGWLTESRNPATRMVAGLPRGTPLAHKTGTWTREGSPGSSALNDVGIVTLPDGGHLVVVILVNDTRMSGVASEAVIARLTRAIYTQWTPSARR
jgi:beta-lactamase class A